MFVCFIVLNTRARALTHTLTHAPPARAATPVFACMAHRYYPPSSAETNGCLLGGGAERRGGLRRSAARAAEGGGAGREQPAPGEPLRSEPGGEAKFAGKLKLGSPSAAAEAGQKRAETEEDRSGSPEETSGQEPEPSWRSESAEAIESEDGAPDCCRRCRGRWERIRTAASSPPSSTSRLLLSSDHVTDEASYLPTVNDVTSTSGCSISLHSSSAAR